MDRRRYHPGPANDRNVPAQIPGDSMKDDLANISGLSRRRFLAGGAAASLARGAQRATEPQARPDFVNPPWEARPSTYWVSLNGFTDPRRITYELEELKKLGFNAAYILEI